MTDVVLVAVIAFLLAERIFTGRQTAQRDNRLVAAVVSRDGRDYAAITRAETSPSPRPDRESPPVEPVLIGTE